MSEGKFTEHPRFERLVNTLAQQIAELGDSAAEFVEFTRGWSGAVSDRQWVEMFKRLDTVNVETRKMQTRLREVYQAFDSFIIEGGKPFADFLYDYPEITDMIEAREREQSMNPGQLLVNFLTEAADRVAAEKADGVESSD